SVVGREPRVLGIDSGGVMAGQMSVWVVIVQPTDDARRDGIVAEQFKSVYRDLERAKAECQEYIEEGGEFEHYDEIPQIEWTEENDGVFRGDVRHGVDYYFEVFTASVVE